MPILSSYDGDMVARIINVLVLVLLGAVVGTVGTVAHQSAVTIVSVRLPWGLIVALAAVSCLLVGVRLVSEGRLLAFAAAVGAIGMILVFSMTSVGGSVLIPNNLAAQIWVIAPIVVAVLVVAWPRMSQLRRDTASAPLA